MIECLTYCKPTVAVTAGIFTFIPTCMWVLYPWDLYWQSSTWLSLRPKIVGEPTLILVFRTLRYHSTLSGCTKWCTLNGLNLSARKNSFKSISLAKLVIAEVVQFLSFLELSIDLGVLTDLLGTLQEIELFPVFTHLTSLSEESFKRIISEDPIKIYI